VSLTVGQIILDLGINPAGFYAGLAQVEGASMAAGTRIGAGISTGAVEAEASVTRLGRSSLSSFKGMAVGLAAIGMVDLVKQALNAEQAITRTSVLLSANGKGVAASYKEINDEVTKLGSSTGVDATVAANALYRAISALGDPALAYQAAEVANKIAATSGADFTAVTMVIDGATNAYKKMGMTTAQVGDIIEKATQQGNFHWNDLVGSLANITAVASSAGIGLGDLMATMDTVTKSGASVSVSVTNLRNAISQLERPGSKAATALYEMTHMSFEQAIKSGMSFGDVMKQLIAYEQKTGANDSQIFGSRGFQTLALFKANIQEYDIAMKGIANSAGIVDEQFKLTDNTQREINKSGADFHSAMRAVVKDTEPLIKAFAEVFGFITHIVATNKIVADTVLIIAATWGLVKLKTMGATAATILNNLAGKEVLATTIATDVATGELVGELGAADAAAIGLGASLRLALLPIIEMVAPLIMIGSLLKVISDAGMIQKDVSANGDGTGQILTSVGTDIIDTVTFHSISAIHKAREAYHQAAEQMRMINGQPTDSTSTIDPATGLPTDGGATAAPNYTDLQKSIESLAKTDMNYIDVLNQKRNAIVGVSDAQLGLKKAQYDLYIAETTYQPGSYKIDEAKKAVEKAKQSIIDAKNANGGVSTGDILKNVGMQVSATQGRNAGLAAMHAAGATDEAISYMLNFEQSHPGELANLAKKGISKPFIDSLSNSLASISESDTGVQSALNAVLKPKLDKASNTLGFSAGQSLYKGFIDGFNGKGGITGLLGSSKPTSNGLGLTKGKGGNFSDLSNGSGNIQHITIQSLVVQSNDPKAFAKGFAELNRNMNMGVVGLYGGM
jgi:TP901 family phage tail tape measure protein